MVIVTEDPTVAGKWIRQGKIVIFPTETVYGIAASALDEKACHQIYQIKNRPKDNPLIIHLSDAEVIKEIADIEDKYLFLLKIYFPGSLTLILRKKNQQLFSSGLDTIAVRVPDLEIARCFIRSAQVPIAAPSCNLSGRPSITQFLQAFDQFQDKVDGFLKGPNCSGGVESTVIDLTQDPPILVRLGQISLSCLQTHLPDLQLFKKSGKIPLISPGMKYRHYAPQCKVSIVDNLKSVPSSPKIAQIGFKSFCSADFTIEVQDNRQYMQNLYSFFNECDARQIKQAFCALPYPDEHFAVIMDRLTKAAFK